MADLDEREFRKEELDWIAAHLDTAVDWARGERIAYWALALTLALGLALNVSGFAIGFGAEAGAFWQRLAGDLLSNAGMALWTSVAIIIFLEILPRGSQRRMVAYARRALDALRARGDAAAVDAAAARVAGEEPADATSLTLDAILARLTAIEAAVRPGERSSS